MPSRPVAINLPDVIVVGCGAGGAVVAKELAEAGLGVVVLEAGLWHDPAIDFNGLEWDMTNGIDSVFRWGPSDRTKPPWPRIREGLASIPHAAGVGGTTLLSGCNSPRAYPEAVNREWPIPYAELVPYYRRVEAALPVAVADVVTRKDELFIRGCEGSSLPFVAGPDVVGAGWRMQPNAILPVARVAEPLQYPATDGCTQCGECRVGCRHPAGAPLERTAKRSTNASYAPLATATGRCEIRTGCFSTSVITEQTRDGLRARGVRYRDGRGHVLEQDCRVVVLAGGAIESPRLWFASGLPAVPAAGRYLTTHWFEYVSGEFDRPVDISAGQTSMVRAEFPGLGHVETAGLRPLDFALSSFAGRSGVRGGGPWASRGGLIGNALKRKMDAYERSMTLVAGVDDDALAHNGVGLSSETSDENNPAPIIRYRPNAATEARREVLVRKAAEILLAAGARPETVHRADALPSGAHVHGTLRMGSDPGSSVLDDACEAHLVKRLFAADTSVFPNSLGGANPQLTAQALASRTAEKVVERYFG
ncbi:MAG: GMC oxidoreductase [Actinomycetota bacterium]|nr:GMC family oxidoreductase [Actinomycetota bacterium]